VDNKPDHDCVLSILCLDQALGLWQLAAGGSNGYLIVRGGESLLIDCPMAAFPDSLPAPGLVLHTQVQEEHCREWAAAPAAGVRVAASAREVAVLDPRFFEASATVWPDDRAWETLGREPYGIAGACTERPPRRPLNVTGTLADGDRVTWQDVTLRVLALPGSGSRALGFFWEQAGCLFSGDLLCAGGKVANYYDYERNYGGDPGYREAGESARRALALKPVRLFPSTGPVVDDPAAALGAFLGWLARPFPFQVRRAGEPFATLNVRPLRSFGAYNEIAPGLFQNQFPGNIILYVDGQGRGVMVDPGNCQWPSWEESVRLMHADLDLLEREAGLKRIEWVLITHAHGDHIQYAPLVRRRYGARVAATPDVADWMATPERFPYPCMLDWYNFPITSMTADVRLDYGRVIDWNGVPLRAEHTPGHCPAHAGWSVPWNGERTFCAGDVIQYGRGPIGPALPFCYNGNAHPELGPAVTWARLAELKPALVLGGHGHAFRDPDGSIVRDFAEATASAAPALAERVWDGDLRRATTPPGFEYKPGRSEA
jgi:glyoxylase-like metal-dependent hydrolase (beta-lactamase superfamily II)